MPMTVCTVYGDLLFFTDFLMDFALLFCVSRFGNFRTSPLFLVLGASLGGAYSLLSVFPEFAFFRCWQGKLLVSLLLVKAAFPHLRLRQYAVAFVYFYLIGFAMAGAVVCLSWFFRERGWDSAGFSYTAMGLSSALLLVLFLSRYGSGYIHRTLRVNESLEKVVILLDGKRTEITALFDTGNELTDPITRLPVIVAEYDAVKSLLPGCFCEAFETYPSADAVFSALQPYAVSSRLRLIPFHSIGQSNGLLLGVCPDGVSFPGRRKKDVKDVVICLYRGAMHTKEHCKCIVNPAILDMI